MHMDRSCHTCEASCHTCEWVMSNMYESCHTCEYAELRVARHGFIYIHNMTLWWVYICSSVATDEPDRSEMNYNCHNFNRGKLVWKLRGPPWKFVEISAVVIILKSDLLHLWMSRIMLELVMSRAHEWVKHTPDLSKWVVYESGIDPCEWDTSHVWTSPVTPINESGHAYEWVMSHRWMSHVTHMNEWCHTYDWVMSHIWKSRVT